MKINKHFALWVLLTLISPTIFAQSELYGNWKAFCEMEKTSASSMSFSDICPAVLVNNSCLTVINEFEITLDDTSLTLKFDSTSSTVPYKWLPDIDAITFDYKDKNYQFKVLNSGDDKHRVLIAENKSIITLLKK